MAARLYSQFEQRRVRNRTDPPETGRRGVRPALPNESTAKWPGWTKEGRRADRGLGYAPVKTFVAGGFMPKGTSRMGPAERRKMHKVMEEYHDGDLRSSSGRTVTKRKQALAIGLSEARRMKRR